MRIGDRAKRLAGAPARQFFDRRFSAVDARLDAAAIDARDEIAVAGRKLLEEVSTRLDELALDVAAVSRAHLESMSYVAAELSRLESTLSGELTRLSERLVQASSAGDADPYAVHALAELPPGARVLTVEHHLERAPYYLATLGYRVTALGEDPYPVGHPNLDRVVGELGDLDGPFDAVVVASHARVPLRDVTALVAAGGLVVIGAPEDTEPDIDGLELIDRSADQTGNLMLTMRRTAT